MSESQQIQEMITQGSQILSKCKAPKNLQSYLNYQLLGIQSRLIFFPCCNRYSQLKQQIGQEFQKAYHSLSKKQRAQFYLLSAKSIQKCQNYETLKKKESLIDLMLNNKQFEKLRFSIRDNKIFKKKTLVDASIDLKQKQLKIDMNNQTIDLHKFLIRRSKNKKHRFCIVLQAIQPFISSSTIHLCFNEFDYKKSYPIIRKLWEDSQYQNIQVVLKKQENRQTKKLNPRIQTMNSVLVNENLSQIGRIPQQLRQRKRNKINKVDSIDTNQFQNSQLQQIEDSLQFFTVTGSLQTHNSIVIQQLNNQNDFISLKDELTERQTKVQHHYLKHSYQIAPKTKGKPKLFREPSGHIIFGSDWRICDNGYFVFINQQKIKAQNSVFKTVVKRIGSNIMSGKGLSNILNISFPVQVFGHCSNLQKMAKAYIYAPKFIQMAAQTNDPIERMKNIACFSLGTTVAYVQSDKPFNPILGQTYQGIIDGCPLYAQQISHHPPICSILFLGRGYRIYGNFQPKFQIGLNTATGRNDGYHNIQFESDHSIVKCYNPAGEMHGLAIGQRRLFQTKKTAYIDSKNRIFCEISWGKQSSDPYPQAKLYDYFRGRIVKIKEGVNMDDFKNFKKGDVQEQYGDVYGRFTGQMYYNGKVIFDTGKDQPFLLQDYVPCLQSDSRFRKDIIQIRRNDLEASQAAKEELEQIQRNDRKLRKSFQHNHR